MCIHYPPILPATTPHIKHCAIIRSLPHYLAPGNVKPPPEVPSHIPRRPAQPNHPFFSSDPFAPGFVAAAGALTPFAAGVPTFAFFSAVLPGAIFGSDFCFGTFVFSSSAFAPAPAAGAAASTVAVPCATLSPSLGNPTCTLNSPFFSAWLSPNTGTFSAWSTWITSPGDMVLMSRACLGNLRIGRLVVRSWRGLRSG